MTLLENLMHRLWWQRKMRFTLSQQFPCFQMYDKVLRKVLDKLESKMHHSTLTSVIRSFNKTALHKQPDDSCILIDSE